ncbi:hypothetical protein TepRe1_1735 [Tepidanaerobacter acetatoxydans Re1]|nr:hypothetical protein TepRe1_1735 [Tepidanaerobacter acetatoxydans Re1]
MINLPGSKSYHGGLCSKELLKKLYIIYKYTVNRK